jgi:peptidoglycan/LPS O-acetylase OafA/YrhL
MDQGGRARTVARPRLVHVGPLDGMRGLAVAAVLAFHTGASWATGGFLGVSAFFTLSGFLITSLLLAERDQTGRVQLRRFWARRARRLVPAAIAALVGAIVFGATVASPEQIEALRGDVLSCLGYVANWHFIAVGRSYGALFTAPSPVQHFWSLAIEEQCYLVLPLVVTGVLAWAGRCRRLVLAGVLGALATASLAASLAFAGDATRAYYGTDTRAVELLVGAMLAAAVSRGDRARIPPRVERAAALVSPAALVALIAAWATTSQSDPRLARGLLALHAVGVAVIIVAGLGTGLVARMLAMTPLRWLGRVSYGVYLYHWPLFLWLTPERVGLDGAWLDAVRIGATLLVAWASYQWLEQPIRAGVRLTFRTGTWALSSATAAVVATLFVVTASPPQTGLMFAAPAGEVRGPLIEETTTAGSTSVPPPPPRHRWPPAPRVLVLGDSIALTLLDGFIAWQRTDPTLSVYNDAVVGCSLLNADPVDALNYIKQPDPDCKRRNAEVASTVALFRPEVVVVLSCLWEVGDRQLPGDRVLRPFGQFDEQVRSYLDVRATDAAASGAVVAWLTCPHLDPAYHPENYMGRPPYPAAAPGRVEHLNQLIRDMAVTHPGVRVLDLAGFMASEPGGDLDPSLRPDGVHLTPLAALDAVRWLAAELGYAAPRTVPAH